MITDVIGETKLTKHTAGRDESPLKKESSMIWDRAELLLVGFHVLRAMSIYFV